MSEAPRTICLVFGTRPEAIKLAPVIVAIRADRRFRCLTCVTAQHRELLDQVLEAFQITPDCDLRLMQPDQRLGRLAARALDAIDAFLTRQRPDLVIVQGDTTTSLCAALAAFYNGIPVAHVEAGLRTNDLLSPWPEEANRVMISRIATLHFAPTEVSRGNLLREGIAPERIFVTGNTVIDTLLLARTMLAGRTPRVDGLPTRILEHPNIVLITGHRREVLGERFASMCGALVEIARRFRDHHFIYPVHLNPAVRGPAMQVLGRAHLDNVHLIEPLPYLPFVYLMAHSKLIVTDSGGIQEEAPYLGRPVLVMRDATERPEAVAAGTTRLLGTAPDRIVAGVAEVLGDAASYERMAHSARPYGDGAASRVILDACARFLAA